jgi:hypothetical protein
VKINNDTTLQNHRTTLQSKTHLHEAGVQILVGLYGVRVTESIVNVIQLFAMPASFENLYLNVCYLIYGGDLISRVVPIVP